MPSRWSSPRWRISSSVRPISSGCSWVCTNQPGRTRAPSLALPVWLTGLFSPSPTGWGPIAGGAPPARVGAEHPAPLAVPDLEVEGLHQPGQLQVGADDRALAGPAALEPHLHLLLE